MAETKADSKADTSKANNVQFSVLQYQERAAEEPDSEADAEARNQSIMDCMLLYALDDKNVDLRTISPSHQETKAQHDADVAKAEKIVTNKLRASPWNLEDPVNPDLLAMVFDGAVAQVANEIWTRTKQAWKDHQLQRLKSSLDRVTMEKLKNLPGVFLVDIARPWVVKIGEDKKVYTFVTGNWRPSYPFEWN